MAGAALLAPLTCRLHYDQLYWTPLCVSLVPVEDISFRPGLSGQCAFVSPFPSTFLSTTPLT